MGLELAGQSINTLALPPNFHAASLDPGDNKTLLAGTSGGVFLSPDGGETWLRAHNGPTAPLALAAAGGDYVIAANYQAGIAISQDGGRQWQPARLGPDLGRYGFREWNATMHLAGPGSHTVMVMCTNTAGVSQPAQANWNPGGLMRNVIESVTLKLS